MAIKDDEVVVMSQGEAYWEEVITGSDMQITQYEKALKLQRAIMKMALEEQKLVQLEEGKYKDKG